LCSLGDDPSGQVFLLMGRGSEQFREELIRKQPRLASLVHATGKLPAEELSDHLAACDILIQPYPDGVSSRRTSVMAGLAHGKPIVATTGELTETLWSQSDAVALAAAGDTQAFVEHVRRLRLDAPERLRAGAAARRFYQERFDSSHIIAMLRATPRAPLRQAHTTKDSHCAS
jgi:glycosyltransferase involved in cell wall biosynthesis